MIELPVDCSYYDECAGKSVSNCKKCKNNRLRNKEINYFEAASDNPFPNPNPRVTYSGPVEHTAGYKCPVCGEYTDPYSIKDSRCSSCGFKMNTGC